VKTSRRIYELTGELRNALDRCGPRPFNDDGSLSATDLRQLIADLELQRMRISAALSGLRRIEGTRTLDI
jgi:hypothetical protein